MNPILVYEIVHRSESARVRETELIRRIRERGPAIAARRPAPTPRRRGSARLA